MHLRRQRWHKVVLVSMLSLGMLLACQSPEDGRPRGGGPGADVGNTPAQVTPDSKIFRAPTPS
jgi:hypothetical protein